MTLGPHGIGILSPLLLRNDIDYSTLVHINGLFWPAEVKSVLL